MHQKAWCGFKARLILFRALIRRIHGQRHDDQFSDNGRIQQVAEKNSEEEQGHPFLEKWQAKVIV